MTTMTRNDLLHVSVSWAYHHHDALGSLRQLTDADGTVTLAKSYLPYGDELSSYGFTGEWAIWRPDWFACGQDTERFKELGVLVVEPRTAVVSLLEHFVRAPVGTSLLLGRDEGQDMIDQKVRNPNISGLTLRDLRLPLDVLVLSMERDGHTLVSRGFTKFQLGDRVTMVGPRRKLEEVILRFDE